MTSNNIDLQSLTRIKYDNFAFDAKLNQNSGIFGYIMYDGKNENCNKCLANSNDFVRRDSNNIIDIESGLRGIVPGFTMDNKTIVYTPEVCYGPRSKKI